MTPALSQLPFGLFFLYFRLGTFYCSSVYLDRSFLFQLFDVSFGFEKDNFQGLMYTDTPVVVPSGRCEVLFRLVMTDVYTCYDEPSID